MSKLDIVDMKGAKLGEFSIDEALLVLDRGEQAVHDVVVADLARRRRATASTLSKGEVAGSNRKPWRQKGTGRARAGYRQSPSGGAAALRSARVRASTAARSIARLPDSPSVALSARSWLPAR